ncbi:tRNA uridine-5-carboxymethylaminomethyl(34) synthesis GTPase MnmE [Rhizobium sp. G21]|uniref:tRNA uridine-5-carboxymethylaminomethyl(34) synthesis GTPase MnmE n=1 Tax=Rhizobium sp. G21 TaxID=2758439 RepID=UPI001603CD1C|nr:tRNA uridine-5-carboxymethylaminomethyl(34) synthesis GTPase MnmE [Rhizobium sp. G21]MBB1249495.1 tRNA uridine-5-carboxymethylaminomethyl(34) synthesis GTPase MnmE [Rhizobium sp. G21]
MTSFGDTIYALSSGSLPSGVAVVRVSGPEVDAVRRHLQLGELEPRAALLRSVRGQGGDLIDRALVLHFARPHSFTGEDVLELHLHGGRAVVRAVLDELASVPHCRHAEPGEFTRRAFDNNRLDLTEAEGIADLISADTEMQRRLAMSQARGDQGRLYREWMDRLTRARALIEAELDFPEEDDVPGSVSERVWADVNQIGNEIKLFLDRGRIGQMVRDGFNVTIIGRPNAGKSSLLNYLAQRPAAIVTDIPGTTRDLITIDLDLRGYLVRITDTAGLRNTDEVVEAEGIKRALSSAHNADLVLSLRETGDHDPFEQIDSEVEHIFVETKVDRCVPADQAGMAISTVTGFGIEALIDAILTRVGLVFENGTQDLAPARSRHQTLLASALSHIGNAEIAIDQPLEIRSETLRLAARDLGRITGFVDPDDLLGVIFSEFCIGK